MLLKEDCEAAGEYCSFHRRFLSVLNQIPSVSSYGAWSQKKVGSVAQHVQVEWIKDSVWEIIGVSLGDIPTVEEFLTELENFDFAEFLRKDLEFVDEEEAPPTARDDDDYLDLDNKLVLLDRFYNALKDYSEKPAANINSVSDEDACATITYYTNYKWFTLLYDGPYFNIGNMFSQDNGLAYNEIFVNIENSVGQVNSKCEQDELSTEDLKERLDNLKIFIDAKKFDDGFSTRKENPSFCKSTNKATTNKCMCECHKVDKVAIYNIYAVIKMTLKDLNIQRFGDVYTYYFYDVFRQHPAGISSTFSYPLVNQSLADEINAFEREFLRELR